MQSHISFENLTQAFSEYIANNECLQNRFKYIIEQSNVELLFKYEFGLWLNEKYKPKILLNEVNLIDLVFSFDGITLYVIEFGHTLLHYNATIKTLEGKYEDDMLKLDDKIENLLSSIGQKTTIVIEKSNIKNYHCNIVSGLTTKVDNLKSSTKFKYLYNKNIAQLLNSNFPNLKNSKQVIIDIDNDHKIMLYIKQI